MAKEFRPRSTGQFGKTNRETVQSQILSAYRFLGLTNDQTQPTALLRSLVEHRANPAAILRELIEQVYKPILKHDLSIMTTTMLNSEFEVAFKVEGETKKKGIRFFLQAAKANGMTLSKFLLDQTRASAGTRKRKPKREAEVSGNTDSEFDEEDEAPATGMKKSVTLLSGGRLKLDLTVDLFELSEEDRTFVFGLIDSLRAYEKKHPADE